MDTFDCYYSSSARCWDWGG